MKSDITVNVVVIIKVIPAYINTCSKDDVMMNKKEMASCKKNEFIGMLFLLVTFKKEMNL